MSITSAPFSLRRESWPMTSAVGAMQSQNKPVVMALIPALWSQGTSSTLTPVARQSALAFQTQTNSGRHTEALQTPQAALLTLRRLSGLTWDQLARLFGSTRRSLHFWASGKRLSLAHEEQLHRLLALMQYLDRGSAQANRALLLSAQPDGCLPFDLLAAGRYEDVRARLGPGTASVRPHPAPLATAAHIARIPYTPEDLAGALQDRVHQEVGKTRVPRLARKHT